MLISRTTKQLLNHGRCFGTLSTDVSASVDSLASPKPQFSVWDSIFKNSAMPRVPLSEVFPTAPSAQGFELSSYSTIPETTKLENGMRVITLESPIPYSSLGVFVDAGTVWEDPINNGVSHFLQTIAFKSTKHRSDYAFAHDMLNIGANPGCVTSRDHTIYSADVLPEFVPAVVSAFGDAIQNHLFHDSELATGREKYKELLKDMETHPDVQIMEAIHEAAYGSSPLGRTLYCKSDMLGQFTTDFLRQHMKSTFTGPRMVVAGVGVPHGELVALSQDAFSDIGNEPGTKPENVYTGGESRLRSESGGLAHIALGFESVDWSHDDLMPLCVLQTMMGGGGSFSAGGPGKGMYSRLYENILNTYGWVESANSFSSIFSDTSIFGIYAVVEGARASDMIDVMLRELIEMASPVNSVELGRAKNALKSAVYMQLETRPLQLEDLGKQYITYDKIFSAHEIAEKIDAVTGPDIQRVATNMLKKPVSLGSWGTVQHVPRVEKLQRALG